MKDLIEALRPRQWVKNFFVFLPLIFGKRLYSFPENLNTIAAFFLFSAASSAVYLANDVMDAASDREHPTKRLRPIASRRIPPRAAVIAAVLIGALSVAVSYGLRPRLGLIIGVYLSLNLLYSRFLKHRVIIDVGCIAVFFLLRVAAGSVTAGVQLSHWILFMTALLALFLGFNKRRQELQASSSSSSHRKVLLQYDDYFIDQMIGVITSSIVVVYMLYTVDGETVARVGSGHLIYSIPFVYYGIFRYLYLVHKARVEGDPTAVLLSDMRMQINLALWVLVCVGVVYFRF